MANIIPSTATEFPDYPLDSLPEIPAGFTDTSWHNDTCPSFGDEEFNLVVFIDYPDAAMREYPQAPRFTLNKGEDHLLSGDDWQAILARIAEVRAAPLPEQTFAYWVRYFGIGFHPDTRGADYVFRNGERCLSEERAKAYDACMEHQFEISADPYLDARKLWAEMGLIREDEI